MAFAERLAAAALAGALTWSGAVWAHGAEDQPAFQPPTGAMTEAPAQPADHGDALPFELGAPFTLTDHTGATRSDKDFRGRHMLIFFGYTSCPRTCSIALLNMVRALDLMGSRGQRVQPLMISVDPEYDTPARMADFVARFDPRLIGLTGSPEAIAKLLKAYQSHAQPVEDPGQFKRLVNHSSFVYLMGPDGSFETFLPPVLGPEQMAGIIASYLN